MSASLKRVAMSGSVYFAANLMTKSVTFLLLPLYTRYLTTQDYGINSLAQAFVQLLITLTQLGLLEAANRLYFRYYRDAERLKSHLTTILITLLVSAGLTSLVMTVLRTPLAELVFNQPGLETYLLIAIWVPPLAQIIELTQIVLIASERPVLFAILSSGRLLLTAVISIVLVVGWRLGAWGTLNAQLIATSVIALAALLIFRRYLKPVFKRADMREALHFGLPLLPGLMSGWLLSYIDRLFLSHYQNLDSVGLYTVGFTVGTIMSFVVSSIMPAWSPYFYKSLEEQTPIGRQRVIQSVTLLVVLFTVSAFALSIFAREVVTIMAAPAYHTAHIIVPWIALYYALGGLNQIVVLRLLFVGRTPWLSIIQFVAMGVTIAGNFVLVPLFDITGAAMALTASAAVALTASLLLARRYLPMHYEYGAIAKTIGWAGALFVVSSLLPPLALVWSIALKLVLCAILLGGLFVLRVFSPDELSMLQRVINGVVYRLRRARMSS